MKSLDFIGAIEVAYDRARPMREWLEELTTLIAPTFSQGAGHTTSFRYHIERGEGVIDDFFSVGDRPSRRESYVRQHELGRELAPTRVAYECDPFTLLSRVIGREEAAKNIQAAAGLNGFDAIGLRANMTPTSGLMFTTHVRQGFRIRHRDLWMRLASHVGAALRLREAYEPRAGIEGAAAVLSPTGRLEHGEDSTIAARDDLARAAKDMDRARGKLRRLDPDEASSLWRAMVRSEWSLVDWIDHDGKRFVLAHDNRIAGPVDLRPLTDREHQVVACAAMGHSNKLIAYDLGLSTGTVSVLLARAAAKLGVSGRVALIRAFRDSMESRDEANAPE